VLFLHGGPGAYLAVAPTVFLIPRITASCCSISVAPVNHPPEYRNNTTALLIEDIEKNSRHARIPQWLVFGGSWGSTLALAYGEAHPGTLLFVLRGIFLALRPRLIGSSTGWDIFILKSISVLLKRSALKNVAICCRRMAKRLFCDDPRSTWKPA
jgi:proline iminopeptidase